MDRDLRGSRPPSVFYELGFDPIFTLGRFRHLFSIWTGRPKGSFKPLEVVSHFGDSWLGVLSTVSTSVPEIVVEGSFPCLCRKRERQFGCAKTVPVVDLMRTQLHEDELTVDPA